MRKSNYRIRLNDVLNRSCALVLVLESILLNLVVKIVLQHIPPESGHRFNLPWPSGSGRQHGEKVTVTSDIAAAPQLGAVADDAPDPRADERPAADGAGPHELADPQGERHVGAQRPIDVRRCVERGRRVSGPNWYPAPGRLERAHDPHEAVRQRRVHDEHGMDVGRDGRVVGEDGKRARSVAVLPRAGRRVVAEGERERQQVTLRRALVIIHQQTAQASVEALVLAEDLVWANGAQRERHRQWDDEGQALIQGDDLIHAQDDPVGASVDEPGVRVIGVIQYSWPSEGEWHNWSQSR